MLSMSQIRPLRCTARIARVRSVMHASMVSALTLIVPGDVSANTGMYPVLIRPCTVPKSADRTHDDLVAGFEIEGRGQYGKGRRASRRGDAVGDSVGPRRRRARTGSTMSMVSPRFHDLGQVLHGARTDLPGKGLRQRPIECLLGGGPVTCVLTRLAG